MIELNKTQKIISIISILLLSFFSYQLYNLYNEFVQFDIYNFSFSYSDGFNIYLFDLYLVLSLIILFLTIHLFYLFDERTKQFSRLQKVGLVIGGLLINYYLVSIIYIIGVHFLPGVNYSNYNSELIHYFPFSSFFVIIFKIVMVSFFTWLWVFIFKNKKTNPSKP